MLQDITQEYEEKPFRYTRRPLVEDQPLEIIAECHLCGVKIANGQEVEPYDGLTFCSKYHLNEYKQMEADGEL